MRAKTGRFNLSSTARAWIDRSVNDSKSHCWRFTSALQASFWAPPVVRLFRILGDPVPEGPILFLNLYEIDKYIFWTKP
jgi:hypothetical protein